MASKDLAKGHSPADLEGERMRLVISAIAWLGGLTAALAAVPLPAQGIEGFKHTGWTVENGGPASATRIVQSADGYIWIASSDGLFRFDGVSFERMPALSDPEVGEYQPIALNASANGDVWVGYRPGALALYRNGRLRNLNMPNPPEFVTSIDDDLKGGVWVLSGRATAGLSHFSGGKWRELGQAQGLPLGQVRQVFIDRRGVTWIVQPGKLLFMRPGSNRFETTPAQPGAYAWMAQGPDGRSWLGDLTGLRLLPDYPAGAKDPRWSTKPLLPDMNRSFWFDRKGDLWGSDASAGLFRIAASRLGDPAVWANPGFYGAKEGLTSDHPTMSLLDREGNIWASTDNGLDRLRKAAVRPQIGFGAVSSGGYGGESDAAGVIYVEDDAGIHAIGPGNKVRLFPGQTRDTSAPCRRSDGSVVTLISGSILQLRWQGVRVIGSAPGLPPFGCAGDGKGRLWTYSAKDGILWKDKAGWHPRSAPPESTTAGGISSSPWGVAFARISATELMRLDPQGQAVIKSGVFGVGAIYSVNEGIRDLLISGPGGLARVRGRTVSRLDAGRYPWINRLRSLTQTSRGDTWMQSSLGIIRVRTSDLDRAFDHPGAQLPHDIFDAADGLAGKMQKSGLWGRQIFEGADGAVRFLTSSGVMSIDPHDVIHNRLPPHVVVSSLTSRGIKYSDPSSVDLPSGNPNAEIAFSALSLSVPERVRFLYRLEGVDDGWIDPGRRRQATYGNLGPGSYRFRVIAANNDGVWNRRGATLLITVAPAFYQTIWFRALCLLLVGLLLWRVYVIRVRHVTRRIRAAMGVRIAERERIARELHDTLLQTFQGVVLHFEAAAYGTPVGGAARAALDRALQSADAALVEGRKRVRELRADGDAGDLTTGWSALAAELGSNSSVRFEIKVEGRVRELHRLLHEEMQRLGEEALRNAYMHANATTVGIVLAYGAGTLRLVIRDDGVGLPDEVASTGGRTGHYGLSGMRERARRIGGVLSIVSGAGGGTEIRLWVPAKAAYAEPASRCRICTFLAERFGRS